MTMTLRDLKADVAAMRLHDLTPTNVRAVTQQADGCVLSFDDSWLIEERDEARKERDDLDAALKQCEAERDELERRFNEAEEVDGEAEHWKSEANRFRKAATDWAQEVQRMREELTALRKRRGLMAGYYTHARDAMAYLHNSKDPAAQALVTAIHASK